MKFREFIKLDEVHWVNLEAPQVINGIQCDSLDFRFEDWPKGLNPEKGGAAMKMPPVVKYFRSDSWRCPIQEGWLVIDSREASSSMQGSLALAPQAAPDIQVVQEVTPEIEPIIALPENWFRFALLTLNNKLVKEPEWPRNEGEMLQPNTRGKTEIKPRNPFRVED